MSRSRDGVAVIFDSLALFLFRVELSADASLLNGLKELDELGHCDRLHSRVVCVGSDGIPLSIEHMRSNHRYID